MTPDEIEKMNQEIEEEKQNGFGRWSWFAMVEKLANGDVTKFESVYKQNFILCLNLLSFWREREIEFNRLSKIQNERK
jgi:UV DNA damage repair endonuclease